MEAANTEGIRKRAAKAENGHPAPPAGQAPTQGKEEEHPGGSAHGPILQIVRIVGLALYFFACCIAIFLTQIVGAPLYWYAKEWYYAWMALSKANFALLLVTLQQWWSPTIVRVSGDESVRGQLEKTADGRLVCDFPERMVLIANHEIYTDWLYLWWIAYTSRMHGHIFIILKESLKHIPLLGWGMQFFSFIFLSRHWETDKERFAHRLNILKRRQTNNQYNPMWMLIFPEGTNRSKNGRVKSESWAKKTGIPDMRHQLLPRSTGLQFCLEELGDTVEWVYDCTLAYEGVPRGEYGQDIYTLRSIYLQGRAPKSVNMYWRRFAVKDIPLEQKAFEAWILQRWREKDDFLEYYLQNGRFPADDKATVEHRPIPNGAGITKPFVQEPYIETQLRPESPTELLQIFAPVLAIGLIVHLIRKFWGWLLVALSIRGKQ